MNLKDRLIVEDYRKNREAFIQLGNIVHKKLQVGVTVNAHPDGLRLRIGVRYGQYRYGKSQAQTEREQPSPAVT